jgi:protocatechuate 3,4-dioxygenase beta subunit
LPAQAAAWSPERLRLVLAHELAHGVRRDHLALLLVRSLTALCWLNPLAWFGLRRFRTLCESAADDQALAGHDAAGYVRELLQLVGELRNAPRLWSSPALSIGQRSSLEQRVKALLDERISRRRMSPRMFLALLAGACALAVVVPSLRAVAAEKPGETARAEAPPRRYWSKDPRAKKITVSVVDELARPVAGARVALSGFFSKRTGSQLDGADPPDGVLTDASGRATIEYPSVCDDGLEITSIRIYAAHPEFCVEQSSMNLVNPEAIVLKRGATVSVMARPPGGHATGWKTCVQLAVAIGSWESEHVKWRRQENGAAIAQLPAGLYQLRAVVFDDQGGRRFSEPFHLDARTGLRQDLSLEVKPGSKLSGRLSANVPRPVRNGRVMVTIAAPRDTDTLREAARQRAKEIGEMASTELNWDTWGAVAADGTFNIPGVPAGEIALFALCDGFVSSAPAEPQNSTVTAAQIFPATQAGEIVVAMEQGGEARVKVLTPQGTPLAGARVECSSMQSLAGETWGRRAVDDGEVLRWREFDGIKGEWPKFHHPDWAAETGADGIATVPNLPQGAHRFTVTAHDLQMPELIVEGKSDRQGSIVIKPGDTTTASVQLEARSTPASPKPAHAAEEPIRPALLTGDPLAVTPGPDFAGQVVDEAGAPLAGVLVDAWSWDPIYATKTDVEGRFRLQRLALGSRKIEVKFSLAGFSPHHITRQPVGVLLERVVLSKRPYFEGTVRDTKGAPLPGQLIRVWTSPKKADGVSMPRLWEETHSDQHGHYLLRVFPTTYEFQVRSAAGETERVIERIARNETRKLDLNLAPGLTLRARVIETGTRRPVAGLRLFNEDQPGIEGTSDAEGNLVIGGLFPGDFRFDVDGEKAGCGRWWSAQAREEYQRKRIEPSGWQRNFDDLEFAISQTPEFVEIEGEKGVRISGIVRDPAGLPVGGATVSIAGGSDVRSRPDGRFEMLVPASGALEYNLSVHDGDYREWRGLANGVLPRMKTRPGEVRENVEIALTVPCVVRGRVVDEAGQPVARREVTAQPTDMLESIESIHKPSTRTKADGTFELLHVRAGGQLIQVSPFWSRDEAPAGTSAIVTAVPDVPVTGVVLTAKPLEAER